MSSTGLILAQKLGLKQLPPHFQTLVFSALGFQALEILSGPLSALLLRSRYTKLKKSTRRAWDERVVSLAHALVVVPLAAYTKFFSPQRGALIQDKAFGWTNDAGRLFSFSVGYFIWDTIRELRNFSDFGFIAHGASCLAIYANAFRPFLAYYGSAFLLWEASTPLLNFHWFFDKFGMTGTLPQAINGVLLLSTFFFARIVYGGYLSVEFLQTMNSIRPQISPLAYYGYLSGNGLLNFLNWLWFYKMINALRKRFQPPKEVKRNSSGSKELSGLPIDGLPHGNGTTTQARRKRAD